MSHEHDDGRSWTFFTNHAHVLFCLAEQPDVRLRDVAHRVGITERAVQRIVHDLAVGGYIAVERSGRRNHYAIKRSAPLRHPIEAHCDIAALVGPVIDQAAPSSES